MEKNNRNEKGESRIPSFHFDNYITRFKGIEKKGLETNLDFREEREFLIVQLWETWHDESSVLWLNFDETLRKKLFFSVEEKEKVEQRAKVFCIEERKTRRRD